MKLILTYPFWFILLCLALGVIFAFLLYWRDKRLNEISPLFRKGLAILRFLSISLLAFLLLEPLIESTEKKTEKPILVIAQDNSESIIFSKDSSEIKNEFLTKLNELKIKLADKFEVKHYTFGSSISENSIPNFNKKETNISGAIQEISNRFYNRNLGAIVLTTDGIYNKGSNPLFVVKKLKNIPLFTIALGDTLEKKDIFIDNILNNRLVYNGNKFPVEIEIKAEQCEGKKSLVKITKNGAVLKTREITFKNKKDLKILAFELEAKGKGIQKYNISVSPISGEFSTSNNSRDFSVDVLNSKQKILIVTNSSHPDVYAIKSAIESNKNYETKVIIGKCQENTKEYNLLIFHNLPSLDNQMTTILLEAKKNKIPILFTLGNQMDLAYFNSLNTGLKILNSEEQTEAQGYINNNFSLFKTNNLLNSIVSSFSPIQSPFSQNFELSNSSEVFIYQKIGPVNTKYPLLAFNKLESSKYGFIVGEGIWKWKLQDYSLNKSNHIFNEIITQSVQYLVSKEDKSFFRINGNKSYKENQSIEFTAETYNKSYELDNSSEVKMTITNENKEAYSYTFSRTTEKHELNAGNLPSGNYHYVSSTTIGNKNYSKSGEFSVIKLQIEKNNPVANHQLLYNMSDVSNGKLFYKNQLDRLEKTLRERENIVDVIYQKKDIKDLINIKLIFFILLLLFSFEWFLRKRNGGY